MVDFRSVVALSRGCVSRPPAKTTHRRKPAERRVLLRITRLSAGFINEGSPALLFR
jgi:hypothetical protein